MKIRAQGWTLADIPAFGKDPEKWERWEFVLDLTLAELTVLRAMSLLDDGKME